MKTILIIEDAGYQRYVYSFDLKKYGFKTIEAGSGEDGISLAEINEPDLIILDVMLPGMDGFEVCKKLKSLAETKDIPVIIVTAKGQKKDIQNAIQSGAAYYFTKPVKFDALHEKIKELLLLP